MLIVLSTVALALPSVSPCHSMVSSHGIRLFSPYWFHLTSHLRSKFERPSTFLILHLLTTLPFIGVMRLTFLSKSRTRLDHLEWSWAHEIETMQVPCALRNRCIFFNVYMGSSGDGAPSDSGVAGYYTTDEEGWPMVVLGQYVAENDDQYSVIPHASFFMRSTFYGAVSI